MVSCDLEEHGKIQEQGWCNVSLKAALIYEEERCFETQRRQNCEKKIDRFSESEAGAGKK